MKNESSNEIFSVVRKIISKVLKAEDKKVDENRIQWDTDIINDLGADSLDGVEIVMEIEKSFNIDISDLEAIDIRTVGDCVRTVERLKSHLHGTVAHYVMMVIGESLNLSEVHMYTRVGNKNISPRDFFDACKKDHNLLDDEENTPPHDTYTKLREHLGVDDEKMAEIINRLVQTFGIDMYEKEIGTIIECVYLVEKHLLEPYPKKENH